MNTEQMVFIFFFLHQKTVSTCRLGEQELQGLRPPRLRGNRARKRYPQRRPSPVKSPLEIDTSKL